MVKNLSSTVMPLMSLTDVHVSFSFLLSWPADMISLKPGKGTIKSRYGILLFLLEVFIFRLVSLAYLSRGNKVKCFPGTQTI